MTARPHLALLALFGACLSAHAAPLAYVASDGNDARGGGGRCTLAAPCRTFQVAHDRVDAGGQVIALDSADYGPLVVTKSVSIVGGPGSVTGINTAAGNAVTIATAGVDVGLRNLHLTGSGGARGIDMSAGHSLTVENCMVAWFAGDGIHVGAGDLVTIADSVVRNNGGDGVYLSGGGKATIVRSQFMANAGSGVSLEGLLLGVSAMVADSVASGNGFRGFSGRAISNSTFMSLVRVTASWNGEAGIGNELVSGFGVARMTLTESTSTMNVIGVYNREIIPAVSFSQILSPGNNTVEMNTTNVVGPIFPSQLR